VCHDVGVTSEDRTLEPSEPELRAFVEQALDRVARHLSTLPTQPAADIEGGAELARSLKEPMPETGIPYSDVLDLLFDRAIPKSFNAAGPGYLAYIPGGGVPLAAVADFIAASVNRYTGVWLPAPALVQLEMNVVRWFCDIVGYPAGAGGFLTTGGSYSNLSALITARRELLGDDLAKGTVYASDQTHHSVQKAALLSGVPAANVRAVPTDERFRIRVDALRALVKDDRERGLTPFFLAGNAGTTNTGAVDDLSALADVAEAERLWLHVDGAYGGFFMLTEHGRRVMAGIERAHSVALDPHKALFMPYGNGALLCRDGAALKRAHSVHAAYLPQMRDDEEFVDFCEISPELSRDFRGLRVWLPFKVYGVAPFRRNLEEKLELTRWATEELRKLPEIEILAEPQLSVVAFRLRGSGEEGAALDALNHRFLSAINARKRVHLTGTTLPRGFALRICVLSFRTHRDRMEMCLDDLRAAIAETLLLTSGPVRSRTGS
jgi:aromatic-L-amino-acid decarboxylase